MPPQRYRPPPPPVVIYGHHGFRPGGFVPPGYVVVDRWQRYPRLAPPPRGYRWVRSGADFALVAIASGIIASVILNGD